MIGIIRVLKLHLTNWVISMKNHIIYAKDEYWGWFGKLATVIGIIAIFPLCRCMAIIVIAFCFAFAFIIPFVTALVKRNFKIKTMNKSNISFRFGDLFDEECFVVTTNRYFDVNPTGDYIAENSLLAEFVRKFFPNNVTQLEQMIKEKLPKDEYNNIILPSDYGASVKIQYSGKLIYFLAFTDRYKSNQPEDFYVQAVQSFLKKMADENHGKTISIPLFGDNNNLSDSGFSNSEMSFKSLMAMVNNFEIVNQRSELKVRIVALQKKRSELINVLSSYTK